jgi:hypothetical protein
MEREVSMSRRPFLDSRSGRASLDPRGVRVGRDSRSGRVGRDPFGGRAGISLLECTIAVVILSISLLGLTRLLVDNERMLASVESWCAFEPSYYVVRAPDDLDRTLGCPAHLSATPGGGISGSPPNTPYEVVILSRSRSLHPESATAVVQVVSP